MCFVYEKVWNQKLDFKSNRNDWDLIFFFAALLADNMARISEVDSEPCQTSKMEYVAKIVTAVGRWLFSPNTPS